MMRKDKISRRRDAGFTLLEILISMAIFAVGLLALLGLQITAIESVSFGNRMTEALNLGQAATDYLLSLPGGDARLTTGIHPAAAECLYAPCSSNPYVSPNGVFIDNTATTSYPLNGYRGYGLSWNVTSMPYGGKAILTSVTWKGQYFGSSRMHSVQVATCRIP